MTQFTLPWRPKPKGEDYGFTGKVLGIAGALAAVAVAGFFVASSVLDGHPVAVLFLVVGPATGFGVALVALISVKNYKTLGGILFKIAGPLLLTAVIGGCLGVWAVHLLFAWVTSDVGLMAADNVAVSTYWGGSLTLDEIGSALPSVPACLSCVLWPLQFAYIRDVLVLGAVFGFFNLVPVFAIWWERKVAGRIQSRLGPMRVGGWHGWAQSFADGIKLFFKEDLVPAEADRTLFRIAPYFAVIPALMVFMAMPFGVGYIVRDLDIGLVFILGVLGVEVIAVIIGGWASNNKWSLLGAMREACQIVSYEIPMGMAILVPVICVGSLSLSEIGASQEGGWFDWLIFANPFTFAAFVAYFIASLASCKRTPFDLAEAESELVGGFHTEYSGFRWALFFFAEYASMFVVSALGTILFLGAWNSPLPLSWADGWGSGLVAQGLKGLLFSGPIWFVLKSFCLIFVQIWLRWTLPRLRIDQLLYTCWQVLLPLGMVLVLGNTLWVWGESAHAGWFDVASVIVSVILGLIGVGFCAVFVGIAVYGFHHRRKLVGSMVVDPLPGA